jgi:hypothetical protein
MTPYDLFLVLAGRRYTGVIIIRFQSKGDIAANALRNRRNALEQTTGYQKMFVGTGTGVAE